MAKVARKVMEDMTLAKAQDILDDEDAEIEPLHPDYDDNMTDAEADADALASAGWGTDEDYGYFGDD